MTSATTRRSALLDSAAGVRLDPRVVAAARAVVSQERLTAAEPAPEPRMHHLHVPERLRRALAAGASCQRTVGAPSSRPGSSRKATSASTHLAVELARARLVAQHLDRRVAAPSAARYGRGAVSASNTSATASSRAAAASSSPRRPRG